MAAAAAVRPEADKQKAKGLLYLSITGKLLLALLVKVFRVRVFAPSNRSFINGHSRVAVLTHHSSLGRGFFPILCQLRLQDRLY